MEMSPAFVGTVAHSGGSTKFYVTATGTAGSGVKKVAGLTDGKATFVLSVRDSVRELNGFFIFFNHGNVCFRHFTDETFFTYTCHSLFGKSDFHNAVYRHVNGKTVVC